MASRLLPRFQPGCIAATNCIALPGTADVADGKGAGWDLASSLALCAPGAAPETRTLTVITARTAPTASPSACMPCRPARCVAFTPHPFGKIIPVFRTDVAVGGQKGCRASRDCDISREDADVGPQNERGWSVLAEILRMHGNLSGCPRPLRALTELGFPEGDEA